MSIELSDIEITANTTYTGDDTVTVPAGKRFQVRHNVNGEIEDILDETTPAGKSREITVFVRITETDV